MERAWSALHRDQTPPQKQWDRLCQSFPEQEQAEPSVHACAPGLPEVGGSVLTPSFLLSPSSYSAPEVFGSGKDERGMKGLGPPVCCLLSRTALLSPVSPIAAI